ncbi:phosphate ABC transporter permease subunit PstC [Miltoncostaea marina]|uniref:phosphate ABC transporter permease subunit PstC n=1 Tax=Miltoncostaea marina TaxID=2843215 RepID=UPI001C3C4560|nr:phosphate ABC transporter permease subunit PstC [Miltoncostaea marina]
MARAGTTPPAEGPAPLRRRRRRPLEQVAILLLAAAATISVLVTVGIVVTLLDEGLPFFTEGDVSVWEFLTGTVWQPVNDSFGVLPLLVASLYIAGIAALVAIPLGLGSAVYLSEYAPERVRRTVKPVLELLAGMPTIVLGFFALESLVPALKAIGVLDETQLFSALAAGIVVGILITPLISSLAEDAMRAVPRSMREGAYGVGATRRHVATRIVFPAALSGIAAGVVLGLSRAVGETMAVTLAAGAQPNLSGDPTAPMQTITAYIVQVSQGEATRGSLTYTSIFAVGILLFVVTLLINLVAVRIVRRFRTVYQ